MQRQVHLQAAGEETTTVFEFTETILIEAPPPTVWEVLHNIDCWWPASNPDHASLERLGDRGIEVGARLRIKEKIAGIPGEAVGQITRVDPGSTVTWEAPRARYRWLGMAFTIGEGVTWHIEADGESTQLSAQVWATFPGIFGRFLEWTFTHPLHGVDKDRKHTRTELRYLKETIQAGPPVRGHIGDAMNDHPQRGQPGQFNPDDASTTARSRPKRERAGWWPGSGETPDVGPQRPTDIDQDGAPADHGAQGQTVRLPNAR